MIAIKYKDWEFTADVETTKTTYKNVSIASAEASESIEGVNFAKQREKIYPQEIKDLFTSLGIDYKKETEVSHHKVLDDGQHVYTGWFHFKGDFSGPGYLDKQKGDDKTFNITPISDKFGIGFRRENFLTEFEDRSNLVQVEFECLLPWILDVEFEDYNLLD